MKFLTNNKNIKIFLKTLLTTCLIVSTSSLNNIEQSKSISKDAATNSTLQNTSTAILDNVQGTLGKNELLIEANNLLNRGYSLLKDQSGFFDRPASTLAKYNIFDYKFDLNRALNLHTQSTDVHFDSTEKDEKGQRVVKEYTPEEIMSVQDFIIKGNYKLPNSNFLYQRGKSIRELHKKKTVIYFHDKADFTISINNKTDFPKLNPVFLADALQVFDRPVISTFDGQEDFLKSGLDFLQKYGTHYLRNSKWGSRMLLFTELKLSIEDKQPANKTSKTDSNVKSGSISMEASKDKPGERFFDFDSSMEIGNCKVDTLKNDFKECNKNLTSFGLLGFEVDYLYNLFNTGSITASLTLPDKSIVTPDKIENINKNMKALIDSIESALDARNSIVSDVVIYNNVGIEDKSHLSCMDEPKAKRFHQFRNSLFSDEHKVDILHPLYKLTQKNYVNYYELDILGKKKFSTYACINKKFNLVAEDLISPHLFNREFINGIKISSNFTLKADKQNAEDCTNLWASKAVDSSNPGHYSAYYLCLTRTSNFLDSKIITDIKLKSFEANKCEPFKYNDRNYSCLCEKDINSYAKKSPRVKKYLCYATKVTN